ncbi:MAG: amidohydrolase [Niabella sp.]|nr:amidohydrolase [Niabella sp.]
MNRRNFISGAGLATAGWLSTVNSGKTTRELSKQGQVDGAGYDIMKDVTKYRKLDAHCHVNLFDGAPENNIDFADRLHIDKMVVSRPIFDGKGTPADFSGYNDLVLQAMKKYPTRFLGQFTLNPLYQKESLEEIDRRVDQGMVGLKVYTQVKISDPLFYPIVEKMIKYKMITHMHAHCQLGVAGYRMKYDAGIRPQTSIPEDFVAIATRYPEAMFQYAHIGGGGDWEYACKMLADCKNVYVDTSGSNNPEHMVDFAVQQLGIHRVFYGTDNCYYQSIGKILASNLSDEQRKMVFFDNYKNMLLKSGNHVN